MSICLNGLPSGPYCLGSLMTRLHGIDASSFEAGLAVLGASYAAALILLLYRVA